MKKQAFTISEILISLVVLGILFTLVLSNTMFSNRNDKIIAAKKAQAESLLVTVSKALASDTTGLSLQQYTGNDEILKTNFASKMNVKNQDFTVDDFSGYELPDSIAEPARPLPAVELVDGTVMAFQSISASCAKASQGGDPCGLVYVDVKQKGAKEENPQFILGVFKDRVVDENSACPSDFEDGKRTVKLECPPETPNGYQEREDSCIWGNITSGSIASYCCGAEQSLNEDTKTCECSGNLLIPSGTTCICPSAKPSSMALAAQYKYDSSNKPSCMSACPANQHHLVANPSQCACEATKPGDVNVPFTSKYDPASSTCITACPGNQRQSLNPSVCECKSTKPADVNIPSSYRYDPTQGTICMTACPANKVQNPSNPSQCVCPATKPATLTIPSNYKYDTSAATCMSACPTNRIQSSSNYAACECKSASQVSVPTDSKYDSTATNCTTKCPAGMVQDPNNSSACVANCSGNKIVNPNNTSQCICKSASQITIPSTSKYDPGSATCMTPCPTNQKQDPNNSSLCIDITVCSANKMVDPNDSSKCICKASGQITIPLDSKYDISSSECITVCQANHKQNPNNSSACICKAASELSIPKSSKYDATSSTCMVDCPANKEQDSDNSSSCLCKPVEVLVKYMKSNERYDTEASTCINTCPSGQVRDSQDPTKCKSTSCEPASQMSISKEYRYDPSVYPECKVLCSANKLQNPKNVSECICRSPEELIGENKMSLSQKYDTNDMDCINNCPGNQRRSANPYICECKPTKPTDLTIPKEYKYDPLITPDCMSLCPANKIQNTNNSSECICKPAKDLTIPANYKYDKSTSVCMSLCPGNQRQSSNSSVCECKSTKPADLTVPKEYKYDPNQDTSCMLACPVIRTQNPQEPSAECICKSETDLRIQGYFNGEPTNRVAYNANVTPCKTCDGAADKSWNANALPDNITVTKAENNITNVYNYSKYDYSTMNNQPVSKGSVYVADTELNLKPAGSIVALTYADAAAQCAARGGRLPTQTEFDVIHTLRHEQDGKEFDTITLKKTDWLYWTTTTTGDAKNVQYYVMYSPKISDKAEHARYINKKVATSQKGAAICVANDDTVKAQLGNCSCSTAEKPNLNTLSKICVDGKCSANKIWFNTGCICAPGIKLASNEAYDYGSSSCTKGISKPVWDKLYVVRYKALSAELSTLEQQLKGTEASNKGSTVKNFDPDGGDGSRSTTLGMKAVAEKLDSNDKARNFKYHFAYIIGVTYTTPTFSDSTVESTGSKFYVICNNGTTDQEVKNYDNAVTFCQGKGGIPTEAEFRNLFNTIKTKDIFDGEYWTSSPENQYYQLAYYLRDGGDRIAVCANGQIINGGRSYKSAEQKCTEAGSTVINADGLLKLYSSAPIQFKAGSTYWTSTSYDDKKKYVFKPDLGLSTEKRYGICKDGATYNQDAIYNDVYNFCKSHNGVASIGEVWKYIQSGKLTAEKMYWTSDIAGSGAKMKVFDLSKNVATAKVVGMFSPRTWFAMFGDTGGAEDDGTVSGTDDMVIEDIDSKYVSSYQVKGNCREMCDKGGNSEKIECINSCENFRVKENLFNDCRKLGGGDNVPKTEFCRGGQISYRDYTFPVAETYRRYVTPLVLDLLGDGLVFTSLKDGVFFDLNADGIIEKTSWTAPQTKFDNAFLCLDKNGNGQIDNGSELFGDQNGAETGFDELAKYDDNHDRKITKKDKSYKQLRLWVDFNKNGKVDSPQEIKTLEEAGVTEISVDYGKDKDERGNLLKDIYGNITGLVGSFKMMVEQFVNGTVQLVETARQMIDVLFMTT